MDVSVMDVVDLLVEDYKRSGLQLPDTSGDKKADADKEGLIADVLCDLMVYRFREAHDALMVHTGRGYGLLGYKKIPSIIRGFLRNAGVAPCYRSRSINNISSGVSENWMLEVFRPTRRVLAMKDCVLELTKDGIVRHEHGPEWMTHINIDLPYMPEAVCPVWEEHLKTVMNDESEVMVLQEFFGTMFIDRDVLKVESAAFLYGTGANGKSVIADTMEEMFGENVTSASMAQLNKSSSGDYFLASTVGKLLAYNSDMTADDIGGGVFKQLVSKEKIAVRPIRQSPYETRDFPVFIANVNKDVITTDSSEGFWRRVLIFKFNKRFSDTPDLALGELKADKSFQSKLKNEYAGVFNWILEGRMRLIRQGGKYTFCQSIEDNREQMRSDSTAVYRWLSDMGYTPKIIANVPCDKIGMHTKEMYKAFCEWAPENGYKTIKNITNFRGDLANRGFVWKKSVKKGGVVSSGYIFYQYEVYNTRDAIDIDTESEIEEMDDLPFNDDEI